MNKYTYIILAFAIGIVAITFWYTSPTQQWERQEKLYQEQINTHSWKVKELNDDILHQEDIIKQAKARIESDKWLITDHTGSIEKLNLCIKSKSMDCAKADKTAMLQLIPGAYATIVDEKSSQDIKLKLLKPQPAIINMTSFRDKKITELYANNPGSALEECKDFRLDPKRIVLHYTATPSNLSAQQILQSHLNRWDLDHYAGYHYIVDADGKIFSTRPIECNALAEPKANHDGIHISYIGDDKPNLEQINSLVWLVKDISNRTGISVKNITAHADIAAKNHKESMEYMFGGYDQFQKLIRLTQTITRDGKKMDALTYAWQAWGDMDFILTIEKESSFNPDDKGDIDNPSKGDFSFGYCQYNTKWQPAWLSEYTKLKTYQEQLNHCHEKYTYASTLSGGVGSRFHGYNDRLKNKDRFIIQ